jgi:uncharacterized integral membrane protein
MPRSSLPLTNPRAVQFTTRTARVVLPASAVPGIPGTFVDILRPESEVAWPRCIQAESSDGAPFDLLISWASSGVGEAGQVRVTSAGGSLRIYLLATKITIQAATWSGAASTLSLGVSDEEGENHDHLVLTVRILNIAALGGTSMSFQIPPFARTAQIVCNNPALLPALAFQHQDGVPATVAEQPASVASLQVLPAFRWRVQNNNAVIVPSVFVHFTLGF